MVFCKTTEICSAKILRCVLKKCWEMFCKTTDKYSAKTLKSVFEKCSTKMYSGVPHIDGKWLTSL